MLALVLDEEKKKYFKIEKSHTAPTASSWSADAVKRRKIRDTASQAARQRADLIRNHIRRHDGLRRDVVACGFLARETEVGRVAEAGGLRGRPEDGDLGAAVWARGLVDKGCVPFVSPGMGVMRAAAAATTTTTRCANMPCFYVGGEDGKTGLGVAYASEFWICLEELYSDRR